MSLSSPPASSNLEEAPAASAVSPDAPHHHEVQEVAGQAYTAVETGGAVALGVIALLIAGLMPLLLSALAEEHRLSASGIGLTAMLEALSTGLVTGVAGIVLKPKRLRLIAAVASALVVVANLATMGASGSGVMLVRTLTGIPEGIMLWIAIGLISRTQTPERWAAVLFTGMGFTQLVAATALSGWVLPRFGANGGYLFVAATMLLALPAALVIPHAFGATPGSEPGGGGGAPPLRGWIALAGTLGFAAPIAAVAVYVVPLAGQAGLSIATGRTAVSANLGCQLLGGALATVLAGRVRYIGVFWTCTVALLVVWAVYATRAPAALFVAVTGVSGFCSGFGAPFLVPMTIEADPSRRAAMQSGAAQILAAALGPLLAALVVGEKDVHGVLYMSVALALFALVVVTGLHRTAHAARLRGS
jgi:hypothetical protein